MSISMYDFSVPMLTRGLTNLSAILDKAAAHAAAKKFDSVVLAQARLFPDMLPLTAPGANRLRHRQGRGGAAWRASSRRSTRTPRRHSPTSRRASPRLWISLRPSTPAQLKDAEGREIELKFPSGTLKFTAVNILTDFVLPNFFFHEEHGLALLRKSGVDVGKWNISAPFSRGRPFSVTAHFPPKKYVLRHAASAVRRGLRPSCVDELFDSREQIFLAAGIMGEAELQGGRRDGNPSVCSGSASAPARIDLVVFLEYEVAAGGAGVDLADAELGGAQLELGARNSDCAYSAAWAEAVDHLDLEFIEFLARASWRCACREPGADARRARSPRG